MIAAGMSDLKRLDPTYQRLLALQSARAKEPNRLFFIHQTCYNSIYDDYVRLQLNVQHSAAAAASADAQGMRLKLKIASLRASGCNPNAQKALIFRRFPRFHRRRTRRHGL